MEKNIINNKILKLVKSIKPLLIDSVDGTLLFSLLDSEIDTSVVGDYSNEFNINISSSSTEKTLVDIYDVKKDYPLEDTFKSLGVSIDDLCLTQHQIINFLYLNRNRICREKQTYIPFKIKDNYFYVSVRRRKKSKRNFIPIIWFGLLNNESGFYKMDNPRILVRHIK